MLLSQEGRGGRGRGRGRGGVRPLLGDLGGSRGYGVGFVMLVVFVFILVFLCGGGGDNIVERCERERGGEGKKRREGGRE